MERTGMLDVEILPNPLDGTSLYAMAEGRPYVLSFSAQAPRAPALQAFEAVEALAEGEEVIRLRTTEGVAQVLAAAFEDASVKALPRMMQASIEVQVLTVEGYAPIDGALRAQARIRAVQDGVHALEEAAGAELSFRAAGGGAFLVEGPSFLPDVGAALANFAQDGAGVAHIDPLRRGPQREPSESLAALAAHPGDGKLAAAFVERLAQLAPERIRTVRFLVSTGRVERPAARIVVSPDGAVMVDAPVFEPMRAFDVQFGLGDVLGDQAFLVDAGAGPYRTSYTKLAASLDADEPSSAQAVLLALDAEAGRAGRTVEVVPLDESGRPFGVRLGFEPGGARWSRLDAPQTLLAQDSTVVGVDAVAAAARRAPPAVLSVSCCSDADFLNLGSVRQALPSITVGADHPMLLSPRPVRVDAGVGTTSLIASSSHIAVLFESHLRGLRASPDKLASLAALAERLEKVPGTVLVAPTAEEARLLTAAALAARSAQGAGGIDPEAYAAEFKGTVSELQLAGLLPPPSTRLRALHRERTQGSAVRVSARSIGAMDKATFDALGGAVGANVLVVGDACAAFPPERAVTMRDGAAAVPANEQMHMTLLAAHLLDLSGTEAGAALVRSLDEAGRTLATGPSVVVAPTAAEARVLAAAIEVARDLEASKRPRGEFGEVLRQNLRDLKAQGVLPPALAVRQVSAFRPVGARVPLLDGLQKAVAARPANVRLDDKRLAGAAAQAVVEARAASRPAGEARLSLVLDPEGSSLLSLSGSRVGRVVDAGFFKTPFGKALSAGRVVSVSAAAVLDHASPGWSLREEGGRARVELGEVGKVRSVRFDSLAVASSVSLSAPGPGTLRPASRKQLAAFAKVAGVGGVAARLNASGRASHVEAALGLSEVLSKRQGREFESDVASFTVLAAMSQGEGLPSAVRDRVARDLGDTERDFRVRWGAHPDTLLASPVASPLASERMAQVVRTDGSRLSGLEVLAAVRCAADEGARRGESAQGVVLSWLGSDSDDLRTRLGGAQAASLARLSPLAQEPAKREAVAQFAEREAALDALCLLAPERYGAAVAWARHFETTAVAEDWGVGVALPAPAVDIARGGVSPEAARRMLVERLDAGPIGRAEFASVVDSVVSNAKGQNIRPAEAAAHGLGAAAAGQSRVVLESDQMHTELGRMDLSPEARLAVGRYLVQREAVRGFGLDQAAEDRLLRGWAAELGSNPAPCPETLRHLLERGRTQPLSADDVLAIAETAAALGRLEGQPARTVIKECAEALLDEQAAAKVFGSSDVVEARSSLRLSAETIGQEEWQGLKQAGVGASDELRGFLADRSAVQTAIVAVQALRPGHERAVAPEAEIGALGRLACRVQERSGIDVEAMLGAPAPQRAPALRQSSEMSR